MFQVYNTICNSCIKKVDYILKNRLIFNKEDEMPIRNTAKKIFVDAATNTDNIENYERYPNMQQSNVLKNTLVHEEKAIVENTFSHE